MRCPECARQRTKVRTLRATVHRPRVTLTLIAVNVIVFLAEQGQFTLDGSTVHGTVVEEGLLSRAAISEGDQYWRLITSGFLHESFLHIAFNMYLLYLLGTMLEPAIGSLRFALIYFTALLCGSFGALLATPGASLGASGAVFGLMGAAVVELRARGMSVAQSGIGILIVFNLLLSLRPGISIGAHIGGLIGGFLAALAIRAADDGLIPGLPRRVPALGFAACVALSVVAVVGSVAVSSGTSAGVA
jgi:membrane associated rhomboid family serine protease